jgi:predicted DNA-binding WGR domain protein
MNWAIPDVLVTGYESLIAGITLPDADDRHVVAAAIRAGAQAIVTAKLPPSPSDLEARLGLSIRHRDGYVVRMRHDVEDDLRDHELRLVDPTKNRFRIYGVTECRTLFGELCLRIVWGRLGNRRLRERSEIFADRASLQRRRNELLGRRRRHGYVSTTTPRAAARARGVQRVATYATERAILEAHGLPIEDTTARALVAHWHVAANAIVRYLETKGAEVLDLVDVSTLAGMFVTASSAATRHASGA